MIQKIHFIGFIIALILCIVEVILHALRINIVHYTISSKVYKIIKGDAVKLNIYHKRHAMVLMAIIIMCVIVVFVDMDVTSRAVLGICEFIIFCVLLYKERIKDDELIYE